MSLRVASLDLSADKRGVAGPLGYVLLVVLLVGSATVAVAIGGPLITDAQGQAELQRAEHSLTLFDSRAAMVALGSSSGQSVAVGQQNGVFETKPRMGNLTITHANYTTGKQQTLFHQPLGAVVYDHGETTLAYQGGGVWRQDAHGAAQLISPPEFHYRGATLTFPVIRVTGEGAGTGAVSAQIRAETNARKVYPNASTTYPDSDREFRNPIGNGTVTIDIESPYYEGWGAYFRAHTSGNVTVFEANETARLELVSLNGSPGDFEMPLEGESLPVKAMADEHPLTDFTLTLKQDKHFNNGHWSLYSSNAGDELEMHIGFDGKCSGSGFSGTIDFSVYYYNESAGDVEEWQNPNIDPTDNASAFDIDCDAGELAVDFTNSNTDLTYGDIELTGSNNKWCFGKHIDDRDVASSVTFDQHAADESKTFTNDDTASIEYVVNHYLSRHGPEYELTTKDGPGNSACLSGGSGGGSSRIDEAASYGRLEYAESSDGKYITYLHVTENEIAVTFE